MTEDHTPAQDSASVAEIVYCYWPTWQVPKVGEHVRMPHDSHPLYANQEDFYEQHPEYAQAIRVDGSGNVTVVKGRTVTSFDLCRYKKERRIVHEQTGSHRSSARSTGRTAQEQGRADSLRRRGDADRTRLRECARLNRSQRRSRPTRSAPPEGEG